MRTSVDVSAFHRRPSPEAATGSAARRHELALAAPAIVISWSLAVEPGRGDGEVAVDVVERAVGQAPRAAVELGERR